MVEGGVGGYVRIFKGELEVNLLPSFKYKR